LLASSQTLSIKEEYCSVPCRTLQNALLMKNDYELVKGQLVVARDSISILNDIVLNQNELIITQDSTISLYKGNEQKYITMLGNKDKIVGLKDKQIKQERLKTLLGWGVAVLNGTLLVIKLL